MMFLPLPAKITMPPADPLWIPRPALWARLAGPVGAAGFSQPLTLLHAPAGFGKTTLVASWLQAEPPAGPAPAAAWLSLDEADNDISRFCAYLDGAIRQQAPALGQGWQTALADLALAGSATAGNRAVELLVAAFCADLAAVPEPLLLVLDDYHFIADEFIHQFVTTLVDNLPATKHLLVLSRSVPPLPRSRWLGRGQLNLVGDLRLSTADSVQLLERRLSNPFPTEFLGELAARTEGWAVGLQLAALSLQQVGAGDLTTFLDHFAGGNAYIRDYLLDEVLERLPAAQRTFLLETSLLERFNLQLVEAVTGRSDCSQLLQALQTANLFLIPLDPAREWFRYHHLWAELLRSRLRARSDQVQQARLLERAARWHQRVGQYDEAIQYALAAGALQDAYEQAADLIVENGILAFTAGRIETVGGWLAALPRPVLEAQPYLCLLDAFVHFSHHNFQAGEHSLARAEFLVELLPDEQAGNLLGEIATTRAVRAAFGLPPAEIIRQAELAKTLLDPENLWALASVNQSLGVAQWIEGDLAAAAESFGLAVRQAAQCGNIYIQGAALAYQSFLNAASGQFSRMGAMADELLALGAAQPTLPRSVVSVGMSARAYIALAQFKLEEAMQWGERALPPAEAGGSADFIFLPLSCLTVVAIAQKDWAKLAERLAAGRMLADTHNLVWVRHFMASLEVMALVDQRRYDEAGALLSEMQEVQFRPEESQVNTLQSRMEIYVASCRWRLHAGRSRQDSAGLTALVDELATALPEIDARALHYAWGRLAAVAALAQVTLGQTEAAVALLARLLRLAAREQWRFVFVSEGAPLATVLADEREALLAAGVPAGFLQELMAVFPQTTPDWPEPLTEREQEV
ncbi:MAG: AAA family ATPase, partial [Anaerolineales bacterium]|nr:AAA family ATPase [Anaerolineales bacterium]